MKHFFKYLFLSLFLSACGPLSEQVTAEPPQRTPMTSWQLSGAIAAKNKHRGWTASIDWQQQGPNQYQIRLFGPLGSGTISIEKQKGIVTYRDGPQTLKSSNAEQLLKQQTGISLPVNKLYYWIRGIPAPGSIQKIIRDDKYPQQIISLKQAGYVIDYSNYIIVNNQYVPKKIRLKGHAILVKFIIKNWDFSIK